MNIDTLTSLLCRTRETAMVRASVPLTRVACARVEAALREHEMITRASRRAP